MVATKAQPVYEFKTEKTLTLWHIFIAIVALTIGTLFGPLQGLEHMGISFYPQLQAVGLQSYYQGLTLHGILNALVWTTFFITGFLTYVTVKSLNKPLVVPQLSWAGFIIMVIGLVLAAIPLLLNLASVLYTFYPPLQGPWYFYLGLTLVVVGSWVCGWSVLTTYAAWRKENKGATTPFMAFGSLITVVLWQICTLGIAAEVLVLILPWSMGLVSGIDPQLARTLFWFTGHPLVYFWLLPAYVSWYGMMPKQAGGRLFSEPLARLSFWLFLLLSVPLGFHHQYADPGVPEAYKFLHAILTYAVFFPSMLTAFNVVASLEIGGRANGGKGLLGWIKNLPWGDPSYTAQNLAMIVFAIGGISGLVNASYDLNLVVHNTAWVPGHFHLTVGTAVTLSFMGILYWLLPHLTGKALWGRKWAVWQGWIWFVGMLIFSRGLHWLGLLGAPRRTMLGVATENYGTSEWRLATIMVGVGGVILFVSFIVFVVVMVKTALSKESAKVEMPVAEPLKTEVMPNWLQNWTPWLVGAVVLVVVAYGPALFELLVNLKMVSPGFQVW
ncbi:MAG: cbb3-type cytochrome c oxidase subunit I [Chloroflexi bacterium]|nr:cbb3-type cytochrome c oxidase subunit I [Chloroflexota bacterium]